MSSKGEWREYQLQQLERFRGLAFRFSKYSAPSQDWDHDHCEGCWAKFAGHGWPDVLHEGYVVTLPAVQRPQPEFIAKRIAAGQIVQKPAPGGVTMRWVCAKCFEEFKNLLGWSVEA